MVWRNSGMLYSGKIMQQDLKELIERKYIPYEKLEGKRVLITGAGGMLAYYILGTLIYLNKTRNAGIYVTALVRNEKKAKFQLPCLFNRLWICGIMMYVNDDALFTGMGQLLAKMDTHAKAYFTETIALDERLTLNQFYSEALKADYDVIYRTEAEYNQVYKSWLDAGFLIVEQGFLPHLNKEKEYSETDRWYTILER